MNNVYQINMSFTAYILLYRHGIEKHHVWYPSWLYRWVFCRFLLKAVWQYNAFYEAVTVTKDTTHIASVTSLCYYRCYVTSLQWTMYIKLIYHLLLTFCFNLTWTTEYPSWLYRWVFCRFLLKAVWQYNAFYEAATVTKDTTHIASVTSLCYYRCYVTSLQWTIYI